MSRYTIPGARGNTVVVDLDPALSRWSLQVFAPNNPNEPKYAFETRTNWLLLEAFDKYVGTVPPYLPALKAQIIRAAIARGIEPAEYEQNYYSGLAARLGLCAAVVNWRSVL